MRPERQMTILRIAAVLAMIGLVFMIWAVVAPTVMPVMLAMSVGQGIGTVSFLLYLLVVATDLHRAKVLQPPPDQEPPR